MRARSRLAGPPSPAFLHHRAFQWRGRLSHARRQTPRSAASTHTHTHIHIVGKGTSYARDGRTDGPALGASVTWGKKEFPSTVPYAFPTLDVPAPHKGTHSLTHSQKGREREKTSAHTLYPASAGHTSQTPPLLFKNQKAASNVPLIHVSFRSLEGRGEKTAGLIPQRRACAPAHFGEMWAAAVHT